MSGVLTTTRLTLRELERDDIGFVAQMLADPEVMRFYPAPLDKEQSRTWIGRQLTRYATDGHGLWLVEDVKTGHPIGQVGLMIQEVGEEHHPEIGYLIHRPFWRRGFASEAATAVRDHAFWSLDYDHVVSLIRPENSPSIGVAMRLGMRPTVRIVWAGFEHLVFRCERGSTSGSNA